MAVPEDVELDRLHARFGGNDGIEITLRRGLFQSCSRSPDTLNPLILAEGDYAMLHGRFSGNGQSRALIDA